MKRRWEEVTGRECRRKEKVLIFQGGDHTVLYRTVPYCTGLNRTYWSGLPWDPESVIKMETMKIFFNYIYNNIYIIFILLYILYLLYILIYYVIYV